MSKHRRYLLQNYISKSSWVWTAWLTSSVTHLESCAYRNTFKKKKKFDGWGNHDAG